MELKSQINKAEQEKDIKTLEEIQENAEVGFEGEIAGLAKAALDRLNGKVEDAEKTPDHVVEKLGEEKVEEITAEVDKEIEALQEKTEGDIEGVVGNNETGRFESFTDEDHFYYSLNTTKENAPDWMKKLFELQSKPNFDINAEIMKITEELKPLLKEENDLSNEIFDKKMKTGFFDKIRDLERQQDDLGIELKKKEMGEYNYGLKFKEFQEKINKLESDFKTQNPDIQKVEERIKTLVNGPLNDLQQIKQVLDYRAKAKV